MIIGYTKEEVVDLYVHSKNKREEIKLLADLTASDVDTIMAILVDAGVYEPYIVECKACGILFSSTQQKPRTCGLCKEQSQINKKMAHNKCNLYRWQKEYDQLAKEVESIKKKLNQKKRLIDLVIDDSEILGERLVEIENIRESGVYL